MVEKMSKSKKAIIKAASILLQKYKMSELTVADICKEADIHRTTFYTLFEDKYELERYLTIDMYMKFSLYDGLVNDTITSSDYKKMVKEVILQIHSVSNRYNWFKKINESDFSKSLHTTSRILSDNIKMNSDTLDLKKHIVIKMYVMGALNAYFWWVKEKEPVSIEELILEVQNLVVE